jgi:hypothetical protein
VRALVALSLCGLSVLAASCASATSDAGMHEEPMSSCGTPLGDSWGGQSTILNPHTPTTVGGPAGQPLFLVKSHGRCAHGARITWTPKSAARLVKVAKANDGLPVAVVLVPTSNKTFTVTAKVPPPTRP